MVIQNDLSKVPKFPKNGICFFWQKSKMAVKGYKEIVTYRFDKGFEKKVV